MSANSCWHMCLSKVPAHCLGLHSTQLQPNPEDYRPARLWRVRCTTTPRLGSELKSAKTSRPYHVTNAHACVGTPARLSLATHPPCAAHPPRAYRRLQGRVLY